MNKVAHTEPAVLTVNEALKLIGRALSRAGLYNAIARGLVPHRRVGRKILIPKARFLAWLEGEPAQK